MSDFTKEFLDELKALMIKHDVECVSATYVDPKYSIANRKWYEGYNKATNKIKYEKENPKPWTPRYIEGFNAHAGEWYDSRC